MKTIRYWFAWLRWAWRRYGRFDAAAIYHDKETRRIIRDRLDAEEPKPPKP